INGNTVVRARSFKDGYTPSLTITANYYWMKAPTPRISPPYGHITNNTPITISSEIPMAEVHYTTNGAQPALSSQLYAGPFPASAGMTVEAQAWVPNYAPSDVATGTFVSELRVQP